MCAEKELVGGFVEEGNREEDEETQRRPALKIVRRSHGGYLKVWAYD